MTITLALRFFHPTAVEFSFEANAPPMGGYVTSKQLTVSAGVDTVLLQSEAWIDNYDDLPMSYEFGLAYGTHDVLSISRCNSISRCVRLVKFDDVRAKFVLFRLSHS